MGSIFYVMIFLDSVNSVTRVFANDSTILGVDQLEPTNSHLGGIVHVEFVD